MAKIPRSTQVIFASSGLVPTGGFGAPAAGNVATELATSSSLSTIQGLSAWLEGWLNATIGGSKFPTIEDINAFAYVLTTQAAYILQQGIPEYDIGTTYYLNGLAMNPGTTQMYKSLTNANQGNALTNPAFWSFCCDFSSLAPNVFVGGTSTGSANAQVVATVSPPATTFINGQTIVFTAGFTNTGAATFVGGSMSALPINKPSGGSLVALTGGEIVTGNTINVTLNTTANVWVLESGTPLGSLAYKNVTTPTVQEFTSGSAATYTIPVGCVRIEVEMVGPGGGGGGAGSGTASGSNGSAATSFGTWTANFGDGGATSTNAPGGAGGSGGTNGTGTLLKRFSGEDGGAVFVTSQQTNNGDGGSSVYGGAGVSQLQNANGQNAKANTGSGGSGAANAGVVNTGSGGGAGEFVAFTINTPASTYTYTVGTGGAGGSGTFAGGSGAAGYILVKEFYY